MQITEKTLKNSVFKIEAELDEDVVTFKKKIEDTDKTQYLVEQQKLIYQGKIMDDAKKLSDYNLTEKGFIVLMLVKPKPKVEAKAEAKSESSSTTAAAASSTTAPAATPAAAASSESATATEGTAAATTTATPAAATPTQAAATTASPPETSAPATPQPPLAPAISESLVDNIAAMGFPRDQIIAALRAAFGNPDRAVEYLMNGIPENLLQSVPTPPPASGAVAPAATPTTPAAAAPTAPAAAAAAAAGMGAGVLERIRNEPQFQQIRQIIRTNPQLLQQFIQQMSRENPDLFQAITGNQEEFIRMINEPDDMSTEQSNTGGPTVSRDQEGRVTLQITENERQAIDRLKQLGFPEELVIQAYFACDKNEELAANFLLSNAFD